MLSSRLFRVLALAFLVFISWFFIGDPIVYYVHNGLVDPCSKAPYLAFNENVLFIGDLHVKRGESSERFEGLKSFILERNVKVLVLVGDLFDSPSDYYGLLEELGSREAVVEWLLEVLGVDGLSLKVYFVVGGATHDPQSLNFEVEVGSVSFKVVGKCLKLRVYSYDLVVLHGDVVVGGPAGFIVSRVFRWPVFEFLYRSSRGIGGDVWLVMAHTHVPLIDYGFKLANTGGWTEIPIFQPPTGMDVLVTVDGIELVSIGGGG